MKLGYKILLFVIMVGVSGFFGQDMKAEYSIHCVYRVNIHVKQKVGKATYDLTMVDKNDNKDFALSQTIIHGDKITLGSFLVPIASAMENKFTSFDQKTGTFEFQGKEFGFFKIDKETVKATNLKDIEFEADLGKANPCIPPESFDKVYYPYNDTYYFGVSIITLPPVEDSTGDDPSPVDGDDNSGLGNINGTGHGGPIPLAPEASMAKVLNKLTSKNLQELLGKMIKTVMGILGSFALVMIMYGGIIFMTASGNGEKQKKGMEILICAGLGVVVIFASYALIDLVLEAFR